MRQQWNWSLRPKLRGRSPAILQKTGAFLDGNDALRADDERAKPDGKRGQPLVRPQSPADREVCGHPLVPDIVAEDLMVASCGVTVKLARIAAYRTEVWRCVGSARPSGNCGHVTVGRRIALTGSPGSRTGDSSGTTRRLRRIRDIPRGRPALSREPGAIRSAISLRTDQAAPPRDARRARLLRGWVSGPSCPGWARLHSALLSGRPGPVRSFALWS